MEALERRGKVLAVAGILFIVFWSQCRGVEGQRNSTKMSYICPPDFMRLGHSCYFFSEQNATWQAAINACSDRGSNLTVPARWEDRNLRNHLTKAGEKSPRWIGGVYDYLAQSWRWGGDLMRTMHYQSFSKMPKKSPDELKWHCIAMKPDLLFRWSPESCYNEYRYICQRKLQKVPKTRLKEIKRWQRRGELNEITVPSNSREVNDPMMVNDVTASPVPNPKSYDLRPYARKTPKIYGGRATYDLRPNSLKKRSRPNIRSRRLKRPFPGYTWNRRDPEGSYLRNAELLRSGRTGLTPQQVNAHLARLQHLRDKQIARRKRIRDDDWLVNEPRKVLAQAHARTYTVDNNISALHPKTIVEEFDMFPNLKPVAVARARRG
ncbi:uncharacterized protein LOC142973201 [Anticarsia gemmatalis]|uniref:uncharacterized protein LOC142973201 n=1 Tax=Anticarsia gemmatalis TaxID=129554 RepID=UPI003F76EAC1